MLHFLGIMPPSIPEMASFIENERPNIPNKRKIRPDQDKYYYFSIRMAALLHDVGHFPFSHVLEQFYKIIERHPHEVVSAEMIHLPTIRNILTRFPEYNYDVDIIKGIIKGEPTAPIRYVQLLNSKIDADRIDYLLRDSYNCGLVYGKIDIERIFRNMVIKHVPDFDDYVIAIKNKANISVDQFLISRYYMYNTVYYHKTTFCFEEILRKIVKKCNVLGFVPYRKLRWLDGDDDNRDIAQIQCELRAKFDDVVKTQEYSKLSYNDIVLALIDRNSADTKRIIPHETWEKVDKVMLEDEFCKYTDHFVWTNEYQNYLVIKKKLAKGSKIDEKERDLLCLYEHLFNRNPVQMVFSAEELVIVEDKDFDAKLAILLNDIQIDDKIMEMLKKPLVLTRILDEYPILENLNRVTSSKGGSSDDQAKSILKDVFLLENDTPISIYDSNLSIVKILPAFKKFFLQVYSSSDVPVDELKKLIAEKVKVVR
jgi:HD superfamily phosphohydrolase